MEQKYQIGNEYGSIVWDVAKLLEDADRFEKRLFSVAELAGENPFRGDAVYAMTTDLSRPLVVVELAEGKRKLIDGNHRLYQCVARGVEAVWAYDLSFEEHCKYIVDFDLDSYRSVAEHW